MNASRSSPLAMVAAFAAIYLIWGSTYLAIAVAIETLPPFLMAGSRFALAGVAVGLWAKCRGARWPRHREVLGASVVGLLMLVGGNGLVTWAELTVPSAVAALLITTVPLWMTLLDGFYGGRHPRGATWMGLLLGVAGVALLVSPTGDDLSRIPWAGSIALLLASFSWANGSLLSRRLPLPERPAMAVAVEMLAGGGAMMLLGWARGEWIALEPERFSSASLLAWLYLMLFGSIVALSAYMYLLRVATAAAVSTYAFVNPVVAVSLGWWVAHEPITGRTLVAASLILAAVAVILAAWRRQERSRLAVDRPTPVDGLEREVQAEA